MNMSEELDPVTNSELPTVFQVTIIHRNFYGGGNDLVLSSIVRWVQQ